MTMQVVRCSISNCQRRSPMNRLVPFRSLLAIASLVALLTSSGCENQPPADLGPDARVAVDDANYETIVAQSTKPVVMEFHADWCGPCRASEPAVVALSNEMPEIVFAKIDVDRALEVTAKYSVNSIPCFIFFKDGKVVGREVGGINKDDLRAMIANYLATSPTP